LQKEQGGRAHSAMFAEQRPLPIGDCISADVPDFYAAPTGLPGPHRAQIGETSERPMIYRTVLFSQMGEDGSKIVAAATKE